MMPIREADASAGWLAGLDRRLTSLELAVSVTSLVAALVVPLYAIVMRALLVPTGEWVIELPTEMLVIMAIYGAGAVLARHGHMHAGFLVARLPEQPAWIVATLVQTLVLGLCGLVAFHGFASAAAIARAGLRSQELLGAPVAMFAAVAAVGFLGWTVHSALGLVHLLTRASRAVPPTQAVSRESE